MAKLDIQTSNFNHGKVCKQQEVAMLITIFLHFINKYNLERVITLEML